MISDNYWNEIERNSRHQEARNAQLEESKKRVSLKIDPDTIVGYMSSPYGCDISWTYERYCAASPSTRLNVYLKESYRYLANELDPGPMITISQAQYDHDINQAYQRGRIAGR
mgnify:CR=1 FL=1